MPIQIDMWPGGGGEIPLNGARVRFDVTFRKGHGTLAGELADLAAEAKARTVYQPGPAYRATGVDYSTLVGDAVTILGAVGGLGGVAALLKVYFERNNSKKVQFGPEGKILSVEGLSTEEIVKLLEAIEPCEPSDVAIQRQRAELKGQRPVEQESQLPPASWSWRARLLRRRRPSGAPPAH